MPCLVSRVPGVQLCQALCAADVGYRLNGLFSMDSCVTWGAVPCTRHFVAMGTHHPGDPKSALPALSICHVIAAGGMRAPLIGLE